MMLIQPSEEAGPICYQDLFRLPEIKDMARLQPGVKPVFPNLLIWSSLLCPPLDNL